MKFKYNCLVIVLFLISNNLLFAQNSGVLTYKLTVDDKQTPTPRVENYSVYFVNNKSIEFFVPQDLKIGYQQINDTVGVKTIVYNTKNARTYFLLKDFKNKKLTCSKNIDFKYYLINDTVTNFKWVLTNERQQILKYSCLKATVDFRGRNFEAWFTDDVPLNNGPWKFSGLPGLIVKLKDSENIFSFDLISADFETKFDEAIVAIPKAFVNDKAISHAEFIKLYDNKNKELEAQSRASYFNNGTSSGFSKRTIPTLIEKY